MILPGASAIDAARGSVQQLDAADFGIVFHRGEDEGDCAAGVGRRRELLDDGAVLSEFRDGDGERGGREGTDTTSGRKINPILSPSLRADPPLGGKGG